MREVYDAIVVGSGAAGGWAAKQLTEHGLEVLLLEAGRAVTPERDYSLPAPPRRRLSFRALRALAGQHVQVRCFGFNEATHHFFVKDRENPYTTPAGRPYLWFRGRQVGGRLHTWGRVVFRLSEAELKATSFDGHGVDWPISYDELAPWYDEVETFLGVEGSPDEIATLPDGRYAGPRPLNTAEQAFKQAVERTFPERRVVSARVVHHRRDRVIPTLEAAAKTGRLTLRTDAVVDRVTVDPETGRASGVSFIDRVTKQRSRARGRTVVLCASTIETLRILLHSASARHPNGLGNSSGRLGRCFMDVVLSAVGGPCPIAEDGYVDPYDFGSVNGFYVPRFRNVDSRHPDFLRGYGVQGGIGRRAPEWMLLAHGEMLPRDENRVTLDPRRRDAWGVPVARIECSFGPNEQAMARDQLRTMHEMAAAAGLEVRMPPTGGRLARAAWRLASRRLLSPSGAFVPGMAVHELGGAGMGDDPKKFVLNRFNQCWDAPNVYVTDGACFVSGCSQNVTLTIMALTARACDHLARQLDG